jgi:hypothetical protein
MVPGSPTERLASKQLTIGENQPDRPFGRRFPAVGKREGRRNFNSEVVMTALSALWLPILVSAVFVFIASSIVHMAMPWHKKDYGGVPNEREVSDALRPFAIPPGDYMLPKPAKFDDMKTPEFAERMLQGPNIMMTVLPNGPWSMGRNLSLWFLYCVAASAAAGLIAGGALPANAESKTIWHFAALTSLFSYVFALWQMSIWYRRSWATTIKSTFDGLIYAVVTAFTFVWLWPR